MMKKIKELVFKYKELTTYVIFGLFTTAVNVGVFAVFSRLLGDERYLISNIIAWFAAVTFSYITNKIWVFESKSWKPGVLAREVISFFAARVLTLGIEEAGLYLFVDLLSFSEISVKLFSFEIGGELIAKGIVAVAVVVINYVFSKLLIFKKKK